MEMSKMKEKTMTYCRAGENCSLGLLRAAADKYGFPLSQEMIDSCGALCSGFGIGGICSALVGAIMVLGILFEPEEAKKRRLFFLLAFQERFGAMDCPTLSAGKLDCTELMGEIGALLEETIAGGDVLKKSL